MTRENHATSVNPIIASYMPLVDFLGKLIGPHCEVVLHDLTTPERSVVAIANGYISGRSIGAPLTDFALRLIKENTPALLDFLHEYEGALKNGRKVRSSTFFIKDAAGSLVGLLCFNVDMSRLQGLHKELDAVLSAYFTIGGNAMSAASEVFAPDYAAKTDLSRSAPPKVLPGTVPGASPGTVSGALAALPVPSVPQEAHETFSESIEDLMNTSIARAVAPFNLPPDRLSPAERDQVVLSLYRKGFFQLRGAVEHLAVAFGLSEATIYRYLKNVQKKADQVHP